MEKDIHYVEYVQALTHANEIRLNYLNALRTYNESVIVIEWLTGI
ncbi:MAG: hypothetical protein ABJB16_00170 [Saprospiraceae bacterium]